MYLRTIRLCVYMIRVAKGMYCHQLKHAHWIEYVFILHMSPESICAGKCKQMHVFWLVIRSPPKLIRLIKFIHIYFFSLVELYIMDIKLKLYNISYPYNAIFNVKSTKNYFSSSLTKLYWVYMKNMQNFWCLFRIFNLDSYWDIDSKSTYTKVGIL